MTLVSDNGILQAYMLRERLRVGVEAIKSRTAKLKAAGSRAEYSASGFFINKLIIPEDIIEESATQLADAIETCRLRGGSPGVAEVQFGLGELEVLTSLYEAQVTSGGKSKNRIESGRIAAITMELIKLGLFESSQEDATVERFFKLLHEDRFMDRPKDRGRLNALRYVFNRPGARLQAPVLDSSSRSGYSYKNIIIKKK